MENVVGKNPDFHYIYVCTKINWGKFFFSQITFLNNFFILRTYVAEKSCFEEKIGGLREEDLELFAVPDCSFSFVVFV